VDCIVLDSKPDNQYGDSPEEYLFPGRYLKVFEPLLSGRPVFVLIYEPAGDDPRAVGRMAYVGWATVTEPPEEVAPVRGQRRWRVRYDAPYHPFPAPVARRIGGSEIESLLRAGSHAQVGNAVRRVPQVEAQVVLDLAFGGRYWPETAYEATLGEPVEPEVVARERVAAMVNTIRRDARFSDRVIAAYDGSCAISGFSAGSALPRKSFGLVDAAHIRPVQSSGPDDPRNGLALTPTLHRLFDAGLFSLDGPADRLVVVRSPRLDDRMIRSPDGRSAFALDDGAPVRAPSLGYALPSLEMLRWHRQVRLLR
jgi:putative restriction endonuclease